MNSSRIVGLLVLVFGLVLLVLGVRATDSLGESVREGITGNYSDRTTWYLVGGALLTIVGGVITFFGARARQA